MKILLKIKLLIWLIIGGSLQLNAQSAVRTFRVLLIGNSFSQNATKYLPQMAKESNIKLVFGRAEMGGCSLKRHWDSVVVNQADTNRGKAYQGKSLRQLLAAQKWDVVTMQQYSLLSGDAESYMPYAKNLFDLVKQYQPQAKILIHQTWAYRADAKSFGNISAGKKAQSQQEMWQKSRAAYQLLAQHLGGLGIIPSGDAFHQVATNVNWRFKKDPDFNETTAIFPKLPNDQNSLNVGYIWSGDKKLNFDPNHANDAGCYLAGMVWYKVVLEQELSQLNFKPATVSPEFTAFLKQTAIQITKENQ